MLVEATLRPVLPGRTLSDPKRARNPGEIVPVRLLLSSVSVFSTGGFASCGGIGPVR